MWDKVASIFGSGLGDALDKFKKLAIDTWHIDPEKAKALDLEAEKIKQTAIAKAMEEGTKLLQLDKDDRDSARNREIQVRGNTPAILAFSVTAGFFGVLMVMMFVEIPISAKDVLYVMVGSLGTAWTGVMAYYFGSSAGSAAKHDLIEKLTK